MATSGSVNFTQNRTQLILDAYQLVGIYGVGRTLSFEDETFAISTLNKLIKRWATRGLHLWTKEEAVLYLTPNVASYSLGNSSNDAYATNFTDQVITQLSAALAVNGTSVSVDSTTGMTVGDFIGVVLDDKSIHWTTIAAIPTSTTLTLTLGVVGIAANNNNVYSFTTRINKPLRVHACRRVSGFDNGSTSTLTEIPLNPMSYKDYIDTPAKTFSGAPNQYHYNPDIDNGTLYLWQRPNDGSERIYFTYERIIEDMDGAYDNFDFPSEWLEPLTWQLAVRLGIAFGKGKKVINEILPLASDMLKDLLDWDSEVTSVFISPERE